jgi:hypothetical protein
MHSAQQPMTYMSIHRAQQPNDAPPRIDTPDEDLEYFYGKINTIIPKRLSFVIHEDEAQTKEQVAPCVVVV